MWNVALFYGGLFLFLVAVTLLIFYIQEPTNEPFEDMKATATQEEEAVSQIQTLNRILTDPYNKALASFTDKLEGDDKQAKGVEAMNVDSKTLFAGIPGVTTLIPLPLSENLLDLPADLDTRLATTILYLATKTSQMLKDIENALACKETFVSASLTPEEKAKCCGPPEPTAEEKAQIRYNRINLLKTVMNQEAIQKALVTISSNFAKLQDIEAKTKDGTLTPNCATAS